MIIVLSGLKFFAKTLLMSIAGEAAREIVNRVSQKFCSSR